jgi:phosphoribosylanthranilate isomerase
VTRIKLSGVTDPGDAERAGAVGVDIVGCVFRAGSPRYVSLPQALTIRTALPSTVAFAGIFVDTPTALVRSLATHARLDLIQLFGAEPRGAVEALGPHAFKALTIRDAAELDLALRLFPGRRSRPEGTPALLLHLADQMAHNWSVLAEAAGRTALLLAAPSLDAASVADLVRTVHPWGVDLWEAVEREPGHLDPMRLAEFVAAVRESEA